MEKTKRRFNAAKFRRYLEGNPNIRELFDAIGNQRKLAAILSGRLVPSVPAYAAICKICSVDYLYFMDPTAPTDDAQQNGAEIPNSAEKFSLDAEAALIETGIHAELAYLQSIELAICALSRKPAATQKLLLNLCDAYTALDAADKRL